MAKAAVAKAANTADFPLCPAGRLEASAARAVINLSIVLQIYLRSFVNRVLYPRYTVSAASGPVAAS
jgi:hypothetical protein